MRPLVKPGLLLRRHRVILVTAALGSLFAFGAIGQTKTPAHSISAPLTGARVAAIRYLPLVTVGSPPYWIRVLEGDYWTDARGQALPWAANNPIPQGAQLHRFTRVQAGSLALSLPLPPALAGATAGVLFLLVGGTAVWLLPFGGERGPAAIGSFTALGHPLQGDLGSGYSRAQDVQQVAHPGFGPRKEQKLR